MPRRLLIANRGEIACRIARTARRLGVATIAVFSDADAGAPHVRACDQAVRIGPPPASASYLRGEAILEAARRSDADAIHPGYGFLSENAAFAQACADAGLCFVGPPAAAIRAMGSKAEAKALMAAAGVPLVPGYHGGQQDDVFLQQQADALGYPLLIKAVAGGGGRGMRRVERSGEFREALEACRREAAASCGDPRVLLERYVLRPRHIEVQVFADTHGRIVHLFERDCSVQRRHQKVLEEAPAPGMTPARRAAMGQAAIEAARAVGYVGAGTVEFIVASDGAFHFMEMNTRLQVEHPVTEMITGLDLVEWQLRVAGGEPLPLTQDELRIEGHAIEARLYAEDPQRGFLPSAGNLVHLAFPPSSASVRIDAGVVEGGEVTPYYDPLLAKLIVHGADRVAALARLQQALVRCRIAGVASNLEFLRRLVATRSFVEADLDTALIERERAAVLPGVVSPPPSVWLAAAAAECRLGQLALVSGSAAMSAWQRWASPWDTQSGWRLVGNARRLLELRCINGDSGSRGEEGEAASVEVSWDAAGPRFTLLQRALEASAAATATMDSARAAWQDDSATLVLELETERLSLVVVRVGAAWQVFDEHGNRHSIEVLDPFASPATVGPHDSHLRAPMPGRVISLLAQPGAVERGTPLLVLEAMKMEHLVVAPTSGTLEGFHVRPGEQVAEGADLVTFHAAAAGR
ncbi:MAG: ATP-grasp domain-containing protein [Sinobacteraceae bacterium]|nr:ATP-grasp domain-containing protein [Nevskiaceae bacterium]MCP5340038.1 ATP-grasp domain-containing protein [Nevskiaceae bacterium]MCP5359262.1 ATP-grasp domain-containing protein [Nevskiaceae bacterium]MCP5466491.1 ATP-grasp domain-containing protein [Nevskiaceae bacterium]MCP5471802.1 ATP-grasp domain-containing protein [Nevskiaceae bacterium]